MDSRLLPENLLEIALRLPIHELNRACRASRRLNRAICNNEFFWKRRVEQDFGNIKKSDNNTWKDLYDILSSTWSLMGFFSESLGVIEIETSSTMPIIQIDVSYLTVAMVDLDGNLFGLGRNDSTMIQGIREDEWFDIPTPIEGTGGIDAVQVSCGVGFLYILDADGRLYSRGDNYYRQLSWSPNAVWPYGTGSVVGPDVPIKYVDCGEEYVIAIDINGDGWGAGLVPIPNYHQGPTMQRLDLGFKIDKMSCGNRHAMFIDTEGSLWGIGFSPDGELGTTYAYNVTVGPLKIDLDRKVRSVSCGGKSAMIDEDNRLWSNSNSDFSFRPVFENALTVSCSNNLNITIIDIHGRVWGIGPHYSVLENKMVIYPDYTNLGMRATDVVAGIAIAYQNLNVL